jgi:hypothetical protein
MCVQTLLEVSAKMRIWKWDVEPNGTARDLGLVAGGAAATAIGAWIWSRRGQIQNGIRSMRRPPADVSEAETLARSYLGQMGVANPTMVGSHFDGETWTIQARTNGDKGPTHLVRVNGKTRTITGWTQSAQPER